MPRKKWVPDRSDIIWIDFNPQSGREMRDMNLMLVLSPIKFNERTGIGLASARRKIHPWKNVPTEVLTEACELLNQIITLTD
jgi:mRNA interferase MazF